MATTPTLFPLLFQRQTNEPIDIDAVFATTSARTAYLTSPRRYAGQIVGDAENNKAYQLNDARDAWILLGSNGPTGPTGSSGSNGSNGATGPTGPGGGGGGSALWREERATESVPGTDLMPFNELFTGSDTTLVGHEPNIGVDAFGAWAVDSPENSDFFYASGLATAYSPSTEDTHGQAAIGTPAVDVGFPVGSTFHFIVRTPGTALAKWELTVWVGGNSFAFGANEAGNVFLEGDTSPIVTVLAPDTDYEGSFTVTTLSQTLEFLGVTLTSSVAAINAFGISCINMYFHVDWMIKRLWITYPSPVRGVILDELVPDPTRPPEDVPADYDRFDAVVLPEHEFQSLARPFTKDPAIFIRKLAYAPDAGYTAVDVVGSPIGTAFVEQNTTDGTDVGSFAVFRKDYAQQLSVASPTTLKFIKGGVETRGFWMQSMHLDEAMNGRAYIQGYLYDPAVDDGPSALLVLCVVTDDDQPASATNPYTTIVWQTTIEGSFKTVSPTACYAAGFGLIVGAVKNTLHDLLYYFLVNFTTGALTWKFQVDLENVNDDFTRMRIATTTYNQTGTLMFYILYANTVSKYRCDTGTQQWAKEFTLPVGYDYGLSAYAGFSGINYDGSHDQMVALSGVMSNGAINLGYMFRINPSTGAYFDNYQFYFDGGGTGTMDFQYNGDIALCRKAGDNVTLHMVQLHKATTDPIEPRDAISLVSNFGADISFGGFDAYFTGETSAGDVDTNGAGINGNHFGVLKGGNAYDFDIRLFAAAIGNSSTDGEEWTCGATTLAFEEVSDPSILTTILMGAGATALVATTTTKVALTEPPTEIFDETDHIIYGPITSRPRPGIKNLGIIKTESLNVGGGFPPPATPLGGEFDKKYDVRFSDTHVYYCLADYDGAANIWVRAALTTW